MRKFGLCVVFFICICCIHGCDNKKVDYVDGNANQDELEIDMQISAGKLKDRLGIPDSWSEEVIKDKGIRINVDINVPDVDSMKVIEATEFHLNSQDKKAFIESITDKPVYDYPTSVYEMTKDQIKVEIDSIEETLKDSEDVLQDTEREDIESTLYEFYSIYDNAPDEFSLTTEYDRDTYLINYENMDRVVYFMGGDNSTNICITPYNYIISIEEVEYQLINFNVKNKNMEVDNSITISEDYAKNTAYKFVEQLEYGDFEVVDIYPMNFIGKHNEQFESLYAGYTIVMHRDINGVTLDSRDWTVATLNPESDNWKALLQQGEGLVIQPGYGYEIMYICVNENGVIYFEYNSPYVLGNVLSSDVNLLSFDKIKEIIRDELIEQEDIYAYKQFNNMELKYIPVKDENNHGNYSIVPVWILTAGDMNLTYSYVVVNAIDGTIVYMNEQYYDVISSE